MAGFVEVPITTSEAELVEQALAKLKEVLEAKGVVGYEPNPADLEVILIEVLATFGVNAAVVASTVLTAVFEQFGLQFLKLEFNEGVAATGTTKWTIIPAASVRHIPAGTAIEAGGFAFTVETETEVPENATEVSLQVVAVERGSEYNKVSGVAQQINPLTYVSEVQFVGETSQGAEEESAEEYRTRLVAAIQLQAPRPITAENYGAFALQVPSSVMPAGVKVKRATSIDGYATGTVEHEATVTSGSTELKEIVSETGLTVGTEVIGTGIPLGTYLVSKTKSEEWKMSAKGTSTPGKKAVKFVGTYSNERYTTTFVTKGGETYAAYKLTSEALTDLENWIKEHRELNFKSPVENASQNKMEVKAKVHVLPEYTAATVKANVETAVKKLINPETWGNPTASTSGSNQWLNYVNGVKLYGVLRYNVVLGAIEAVPGVAYVFAEAAGLEIGLEGGTKGTADLQLVGPAPLPEVAVISVTTE
jgi:hypothetical protein